jgi:AAA+ ATPase superfamily predicted ATPase
MTSLPFVYGRIVETPHFINRQEEINRLKINLTSGLNTVLISPRRWGKSSLVNTVVRLLKKNRRVRVCVVDLFNIRSEQEFIESYTREILKNTSSKWEEWLENGKKFLAQLAPRFSFGSDPYQDFSVSFNFSYAEKELRDVLDLPEKIAATKGLHVVVCIDEFQNISYYNNPLGFQKKLRSAWQHHRHTTYCLYGSKRHMMSEIFENKSHPFYKFGEVIFLKKIATEHWLDYLRSSFEKSNKAISDEQCREVVSLAANNPYFVQQLALKVWLLTEKKVTSEIIDKAVDDILMENSIVYLRDMENLSNTQINYLHAVCDRVPHLTSSDTLQKYRLGTSANVLKIKKALEQKEMLDLFTPYPEFVDPIFELWLKRIYFHDHPRNH